MFYYVDKRSPLLKNHKEFVIYRDLIFLYKLMVAEYHPRKSPKLMRWQKDQAAPYWEIKEFDPRKTLVDLNVACFSLPCVSIESKLPYSPTDAQNYIPDQKQPPTEDDVLHSKEVRVCPDLFV